MQRLNVVGLDTAVGYKTLELWNGDITELGCEVDLLVVSAFRGGYEPIQGTVFGSLETNLGVSIADLAAAPELDLRAALGSWVSAPVADCEFARIVCTELVGRTESIGDALQSLFATIGVLEAKGISVGSIAMPVLGTGSQRLPSAEVIKALLMHARNHVARSLATKRIMFVERDARRASELSDAMNHQLKRSHVSIPRTQLISDVRGDILRLMDDDCTDLSVADQQVMSELRVVLQRDDVRSFELGVIARKLAERITDSLLAGSTNANSLDGRIRALGEKNIAMWIQQYLHVLRVVGNEAAHEKSGERREPPRIQESDVAISLLCMRAVMEFWLPRCQRDNSNRSV
jgi:O-acetyl-ADP-ribose deacetylase (regulator of RNase III)